MTALMNPVPTALIGLVSQDKTTVKIFAIGGSVEIQRQTMAFYHRVANTVKPTVGKASEMKLGSVIGKFRGQRF